jgi:hypothetical protein
MHACRREGGPPVLCQCATDGALPGLPITTALYRHCSPWGCGVHTAARWLAQRVGGVVRPKRAPKVVRTDTWWRESCKQPPRRRDRLPKWQDIGWSQRSSAMSRECVRT